MENSIFSSKYKKGIAEALKVITIIKTTTLIIYNKSNESDDTVNTAQVMILTLLLTSNN